MPQFLSNKDVSIPCDSVPVTGEGENKMGNIERSSWVKYSPQGSRLYSIRVIINLYQRRLYRRPIH